MTPTVCHQHRPTRRALLPGLCAAALALAGLAAGALSPAPVRACGGLFCNAITPVNQTAERILFVDHGDGTTTAAIEIMYSGPAERFAWVLPLGDIENPDTDIRVSSVMAFDRLQQATNPIYQLTREVEGTCKQEEFANGGGAGGFAPPQAGDFDSSGDGDSGGEVIVEASGSVGPFDYEFISVVAGTTDPAQAAIDWLTANEYDLGIGDEVLAPYLESGMKLLAVRLTKGNDTGSIRPLMVTYSGTTPSIPIRPTAVAAEDDMGVMVFLGGESRAIPKNYKDLVLNDAIIDWFNFGSNYGAVVNAAADEAGGQGFVTEYAAQSSALQFVVVQDWERQDWMFFQGQVFTSDVDMFNSAQQWGNWDGFADALGMALTVSGSVTVEDVINCPTCYLDGADPDVVFDRPTFRTALYEQVTKPMFDTEDLVQEMPYVSRLYTTMSAEDMTVDPIFDQNPDLADVDNNHNATMVIECSSAFYQWEAPYRVELESGLVLHGADQNVWPVTLASVDENGDPIPANITIAEVGVTGPANVILDNTQLIQSALDAVEIPSGGGDGDGDIGGPNPSDGFDQVEGDGGGASVCGCRVVGGDQRTGGAPLVAGLFLGLWALRRRRA